MITKFMALSGLCLAMLAQGVTQAAVVPSESALEFTRKSDGVLDITYQGRRLLRYAFAASQFKPYVRELYNLKGDNVLLDAPPDHLHHHGLMYAIRVNGVNFWEERDQPGYEKPLELVGLETRTSKSGLPQASFTQLIHWVQGKDSTVSDSGSAALLVERRTITITVDERSSEVALDWHAEFELGRGVAGVTLSGSSYHGLGLRLPESFNRVARHENSEGAPYPTEGKGDVTAARWSAVTGRADGRDITVALFGRPAKAGALPIFFTMVQPFTYLSVTEGLDKAPVRYAAGEKFSLGYRLAVYSEQKSAEFLGKRYADWSAQ